MIMASHQGEKINKKKNQKKKTNSKIEKHSSWNEKLTRGVP